MMIDGDSADISQPSKAQRYAKQLSSVRWFFAFPARFFEKGAC
jgi:hypothetical protein